MIMTYQVKRYLVFVDRHYRHVQNFLAVRLGQWACSCSPNYMYVYCRKTQHTSILHMAQCWFTLAWNWKEEICNVDICLLFSSIQCMAHIHSTVLCCNNIHIPGSTVIRKAHICWEICLSRHINSFVFLPVVEGRWTTYQGALHIERLTKYRVSESLQFNFMYTWGILICIIMIQ